MTREAGLSTARPAEISGRALAPGRATGTIFVVANGRSLAPGPARGQDADRETLRFARACAELKEELLARGAQLDAAGCTAEGDIFRAQAALLEDDGLCGDVDREIRGSARTAAAAASKVMEGLAEALDSAPSDVLQERAADCRDLAQQLRRRLNGHAPTDDLSSRLSGAVVVVGELLPSLVLQAWEQGARAFVVAQGTRLSHAAIIAQSTGMPILRIANIGGLTPHEGRPALVDADRGCLVLDPHEEADAHAARTKPSAWNPAALPVRLGLSIIAPGQLVDQDWRGIEGVGLYRTEMLFLQRDGRFPTEEEQYRTYRRLFALCGDRPVVIRAVDLGADKRVQHMHFGPERNPYLGLRAHRLYRFHPELLITQVRAVLRAAASGGRLRLLFPMIETLDQWRFVQSLVGDAARSLEDEGRPAADSFAMGILIETPAAVWSFTDLLEHADFASVGTNDLVQYIFAAERDAPNVAAYYQPEHPIMLRILRELVQRARNAGKDLSICGEIASEPRYLPILVGLGFEHLTVSASQHPQLASVLAELDVDACRSLVSDLLEMRTVDEVRARLPVSAEGASRNLGPDQAIDPVCGMVVDTSRGEISLSRNGLVYHFCCAPCRSRFRARLDEEASAPTLREPDAGARERAS